MDEISEEEKELLANGYICPKCGSLHLTSANVEGNVCLPPTNSGVPLKGQEPCDGILRRMTSEDIDELVEGNCEFK